MGEITFDKLIALGFKEDQPGRCLGRVIKTGKNPEWRVSVERQYKSLSNELGYAVSCWKCDERGAINHRSSVSVIDDMDTLLKCIELCEISLND